MAQPLSMDLRTRVLSAVAEGASGRSAGRRFGVSAPSVSRWRALERTQGDAAPKPVGGDRRSHETEAHAAAILAAIEARADLTLEEHRPNSPGMACSSAMARFGDFSTVTRSRAKKVRARCRTGAPGYREAKAGLVRRPTRPRSRTPRVHRRDLGLDQHVFLRRDRLEPSAFGFTRILRSSGRRRFLRAGIERGWLLALATASYARASPFRSKVLNLANTCSIGLRSGEYFGRNTRRAPTARMARRTAFPLWEPRLSRMTTSPGLRVGVRNCPT